MPKNGSEYELFVAKLQQAILNAEPAAAQRNIKVEANKFITDNCGIEREFDIYWEYELGGLIYKTVIECKDYKSKISVEKIDALIGKIKDIPDLKAVFATKEGYQSGAKTKADQNKIELLVVREQNTSDWTTADGAPLIREVCINIHISTPARIHTFKPILDGKWIKENTSVDVSQPLSITGLNNEIFIENLESGERYSLLELSGMLSPLDDKQYGTFEKVEELNDAYICYGDMRLKIVGYQVKYSVSKPILEAVKLDFSKELIGVIEYLQSGKKRSIFKNGVVR